MFAPASLAKNPDRQIVATAVAQLLAKGTPIEQTINACKDINEFVLSAGCRAVHFGVRRRWARLYASTTAMLSMLTSISTTLPTQTECLTVLVLDR